MQEHIQLLFIKVLGGFITRDSGRRADDARPLAFSIEVLFLLI